MSSIPQFAGESSWDALINYEGLDIEEEARFLEFVQRKGFSPDLDIDMLESLYNLWYIRCLSGDEV